jgi:hypothetical protein
MFKKIVISTAMALQIGAFCLAQAETDAPNNHLNFEQVIRVCKNQANRDQIKGEQRRVFITQCVRKATESAKT